MDIRPIHKLSIIIPCYNEERTLKLIVEEILAVDTGATAKEIVIIDDCSKDKSLKIARELQKKHKNVKVLAQSKNQGKGVALKRGFMESSGDVVIIQDADREYDPRDYNRLLDIFREDRADVVFGSRFSGGAPRRVVYLANTVANKLMTRLSAVLSGLYVSDIHTCYIMLDGDWIRKAAPTLQSRRFGFNPEIVAVIAKEKEHLRICETSISYYGRSRSEGKKIRFTDGIEAIWDIVYYNLKPRSRY
ncbi:MAG TPA: glycosyltransferase family 2 protein [Candidatus Saccharimonadales bacterium]|nr:glycosyltransferase family 2 protein [Candidatus Saccharimonadales bacterium]